MLKYLPIINLFLLLTIGAYVFFYQRAEKKAYVLNQRVFDEFKGKKELEEKLLSLKNSHKLILDSMIMEIQSQPDSKILTQSYQETLQTFELQQQELSARYTADIWKRINQYISEYGKDNDYDFIFGAAGDGSLMYADDVHNITDEVIVYVNKKYE